jgi:hypothetical protein
MTEAHIIEAGSGRGPAELLALLYEYQRGAAEPL